VKTCTKCKGHGPFGERGKGTGRLYAQCAKCRGVCWRASYVRNKSRWLKTKAAKSKASWRSDLEGSRARRRRYHESLAKAAVVYLGSKCGCGEDDPSVLHIDHIFGGGEAERREGVLGRSLYRAILRGERDGELQLLCANCHRIKGKGLKKAATSPNAEAVRRSRAKARSKAITLLGGQCKCGVADERVLEIDHVAGDGAKDRKARHKSGSHYIVKQVLADSKNGRFQLLCASCNWKKRMQTPYERGGGPPLIIPPFQEGMSLTLALG